jgi:hypothetical protein
MDVLRLNHSRSRYNLTNTKTVFANITDAIQRGEIFKRTQGRGCGADFTFKQGNRRYFYSAIYYRVYMHMCCNWWPLLLLPMSKKKGRLTSFAIVASYKQVINERRCSVTCHDMRILGIWLILNQSLPVSFLQFSVSAELQPLTINSSSAVKHRKPSGNETNFWQQLISRDSSAMRSPSHSGRTSKSAQLSILSLRSMLRYLMACGKTCRLSQYSIVRSSSFGLCWSKFQSFDDA